MDLRLRAVSAYDKDVSSAEVADELGVSSSWVRKMRLRLAALGHLEPTPHPGGAPKISNEQRGTLMMLATRMSVLVPRPLQALRRAWQNRIPIHEDNTPTGARENIHRHYDLSNELFELFLDPTLTYSAAWFEPGDDLETAQYRKIDGVLDLARVRPGAHVLEIGSGWGALAMRAAAESAVGVLCSLNSSRRAVCSRLRAPSPRVKASPSISSTA